MESSSFSASLMRRSMTARKNLSLSAISGLGIGLGLAAPFDFVFFRDIFDTFLGYLEYAFAFG
jgi:hypothetical protein